MTDAELQERYQEAVRREAGGRAPCPTPEQILALVERTGDEASRLETLDHAMSCEACHRDVALLQAIHAARPRQALLQPRQWLIAASLLVVLAGGALVSRGLFPSLDKEPLRGGGGAGSAEGLTVIPPVGPVARGLPGTLLWHAVPGAVDYVVEVLDDHDHVVFSRQTADTSVAVPALAAPTHWWVRAAFSDGTNRRSPMEKLQ